MDKLSVSLTRKERIFGWIYYPIQLLALPILIRFAGQLAGFSLNAAVENFVYFSLNFICICLFFFRFLKENGKKALQKPLRCLSSAFIGLCLYWGLSYIVQIFILTMDPDFFNVNDASIGSLVRDNFLLTAVGTVLLVPTAEEVLYRGLFFSRFYNRKPLAAYLISTCVFAAVHVVAYIGQFAPMQLALCFLQYLPAGIALGWAYARADSIWSSILMHITINLIGVISMR